MGRGVYRNYYKGHKDRVKGKVEVREGGGTGWRDGEKMQTIVTE